MRALLLLAVFLPLGVGCGEEDSTLARFTPSAEKNALARDDTTPALKEVAIAGLRPARHRGPAGVLVGSFTAYPGSSAAGAATLAAAGEQTRVDVRLSGGQPAAHYEGAIRRGTCTRVGARVAGLNAVSADPSGSGRAFTDAAVPVDSLAHSPHVLVYGRGGRPETCAPVGSGGGA
jgi:hypothetical protein